MRLLDRTDAMRRRETMTRRCAKVLAWCAASLALAVGPALAEGSVYPDKPVRIINPFPPGSPVDTVGRLFAQRLGTVWKHPAFVESKSGAGGTLGTAFVASSTPDGTTLLVSTQSPVLVAPLINKTLGYDPERDLVPVWAIASSGLVIVVTPSLKVNGVAELIEYAKAHPKELAYGTSGTGTVQHLAGELFISKTGAPLLHVPYRGGAPAATDLIGGQVQVMFDSLSNQLGNIKAGKVRALAVMRPTRANVLPDVPTLTESGIKGADMRGWIGVFAPKGMPPRDLAKLRADASNTMKGPELQSQLAVTGLDGELLDADAFGRYIKEDMQQLKELVRTANIQADVPATK